MYKKIILISLVFITIVSCAQQEARKPINVRSGTFLKESVERNKALIAQEEAMIQDFIQKDSAHTYIASKNGFWYFYEDTTSGETYTPQKGDTLRYEYNIAKIASDTIYTKQEIGIQEYVVNKQQIISGLRYGLQLMKKGETVTFLFPSHVAYGYHGDNKKVGTNVPIQSTITLLNIKKNNKNLEN
ncbi:gliding motility-associated peptidyl-prolyl isomerase GldI [uncultured Kordia sp.]|uniref:gliding motility-associated peptidyl-prolyl isomerase GldI n=1 Tax=uncultured Kordia sp. TaxID=507699 RepID=UPI002635B30C|nr:gliding motility-associated peptidyl-prolyl isomerase GldI [uncultured Kordia sp.]